jgi:AraC-like DNA-binding protein
VSPDGQTRIRSATFTYEKGQIDPEHEHPEHQLVYARFGLLLVDTEPSRWVVPPLRAVWVPAATPHTITAKADSEMSALYIDRTAWGLGPDAVTVVAVSNLLRELISHLTSEAPTGPARAHLEEVVLDQMAAAHVAPLELPRVHDSRVQAIADALEADPRDDRTLPEFGAQVGASARTLQRLFHAETGTTFGRWRTQLRLQHAIIELGIGASVSAAATSSGYREVSSFIEAFRHVYGTTPGRYFDVAPAAPAPDAGRP